MDTQNLGKVMIIATWVLVLLLFSLFLSNIQQQREQPFLTQKLTHNGNNETILKRNYHNQYIASGKINGKTVFLLVDTGATDIIIPGNIAKDLALYQGEAMMADTAGGNIIVYQTYINELEIGNIALHHLTATINPKAKGTEILLGMSVLKQLNFQQQGNELTLKSYAPSK